MNNFHNYIENNIEKDIQQIFFPENKINIAQNAIDSFIKEKKYLDENEFLILKKGLFYIFEFDKYENFVNLIDNNKLLKRLLQKQKKLYNIYLLEKELINTINNYIDNLKEQLFKKGDM